MAISTEFSTIWGQKKKGVNKSVYAFFALPGMAAPFLGRACQLAGKLNWKCKSPRFTGWYLIEKSVSESQRVS